MIARRSRAAGLSQRRSWTLATLSLSVTVAYGVLIYAFPVLLSPMERSLHLRRGAATLALSIALLLAACLSPPAGRWLDRRSPRQLMGAGGLIAAAGLIAWSSVGSLWQLYGAFALLGVAMALLLYAPAFTVIAKVFWPTPRRALIALTLVGGLAGLIFTPLTEWLVGLAGWRGAVLVLAAIALLLAAMPNGLLLPPAVRENAVLWPPARRTPQSARA